MENEKKVQSTKVEVQKEVIKTEYEGIKIVKDDNFIPRSRLTRDDVKKFSLVLVSIIAKFYHKENNERDSIQLKVYPFVDIKSKDYETNLSVLMKSKLREYYKFVKLNEDNKVKLDRNDLGFVLFSINKLPTLKDQKLTLPRYARFITAVKDGRRHYRLQLFLSFDLVKTIFISDSIMKLIETCIHAGVIDPVEFIEATSEELELESSGKDKDIELM